MSFVAFEESTAIVESSLGIVHTKERLVLASRYIPSTHRLDGFAEEQCLRNSARDTWVIMMTVAAPFTMSIVDLFLAR